MSDPASPAVAPAKAERVFTWPLLAFLAAVAVAAGRGWVAGHPRPDLEGTVRLLGDGDLDRAERDVQLERLRAFGAAGDGDFARWAGLLACIELGDRTGHAAAVAALGGVPQQHLPAVADRRFLHLGNPLLGNVLAAAVVEAGGDPAGARTRWQQVAMQARLMAKPLPAELAAAAIARLAPPK